MNEIFCWRCGGSLAALSLPLSRRDECPHCRNELHVCRMCTHYDPGVVRSCREDDADEVKEKQRANFCDYFRPSTEQFAGDTASADARARDQLEGLFGDSNPDDAPNDDEPNNNPDQDSAEDLFS